MGLHDSVLETGVSRQMLSSAIDVCDYVLWEAGALVMLSEAKHLGLEWEIRPGYAGGVLRGGQILR